MKCLVIHHNGNEDPDQCGDVVDGELARLPAGVCEDPTCGCSNHFIGLASGQGSTTVRVADLKATRSDLFVEYVAATKRDGATCPADTVDSIITLAEKLPVGTVMRPHYDRAADTWNFRIINAE
jgi:hypothetical protein